jgi:hypothetical protein
MKKEIKEGLEKFVTASPNTKVLFLFIVAIVLAAIIYSIFMLLAVQ